MVNAAEQTKSLVIVDDNANLITAAFHSNCGGRTNNSENVWSRPLSYCRAVEDTFCMKMPNSNWEKRIPLQEWTRYLESKKIESTDSANYAYFPGEKEVYYREGNTKVPLVTMRKDLKLKSTYFSAHQDGNDIVLIGQGFGHGVGLCQEGAIRMAQLGYGFEDIIHFYYTQVKIIPYQYIAFFKLE
jgi:stage II sporulation protein D